MGVSKLYILFIFYISCTNGLKTYDDRPRILVSRGHLRIIASPGKNIDFVATGQSVVSINDVNVLTTLTKAHSATKLTETYQQTLTSYNDRLEALESRSMDPVMISNFTNSTDQLVSRISFRRLTRRVELLQRRLSNIQTLLYRDDCSSNPCKNGGTCQDMFGNFLCHCTPQWEGEDCTVDVNECNRFQGTDLGCQNGAVCVNTIGSYRCDCVNGYIGLHCLRKKVDCATAGPELCGHGTCVVQNNQEGFKCLCDPGWTTDGRTAPCTVDVNECLLSHPPCAPKVECINVPGSFFCGHCPPGFNGNGYQCNDIDECLTNNGGCSMNPTVLCMNTHGSRVCGPCPSGYSGDGVRCSYQGVCNINNGGCHSLATCLDRSTLGTIECICPFGYVGSGAGPNGCVSTNVSIHGCSPNPCLHGRCSVNPNDGSYHCDCYRYYTGQNCNILKSDACTPNPCQNDGECQNVNNRLKCNCKTGFSGVYCQTQLQGCGGYLRSDNGTLKFPSGDFQTYNHRSNCAWTIMLNSTSNVIKVNISKFDIEESLNCAHDWLEIHDGQSTAAHTLGRFCGNKIPLNGSFTSTHDTLYLWFRSDSGVAKGGFQLSWTSVKPLCDGLILSQSTHGSIQSPGSPGNYPLNRDCHWRLLAPYDKRYMFHFFSLDIGENKDCEADYLKFYATLFPEGRDTPFAKFCNSSRPAPFYSPGNRVNVHFHSDEKDTHPGFQMTYSAVEGVPGCGGVFTAAEGIITSPNAENGDFTICQYKIQQSTDRKIKINFINFDLDALRGCSFNYLEIHDGPDENAPSIGRYCGKTVPASFISSGNQLTIVSSSSGERDNKGWKLEYINVCGQTYTDESGSFNAIPSSRDLIDCIYQIQRPPGNVILLLMKINMRQYHMRYRRDEGSQCYSRYIEVRDGDHENATLIGKYCNMDNINITSTHNSLWMRVRYRSRLGSMGNSILVQYTSINAGCGGILRNKFGNVASPSHPNGYYPQSLNCKWTIIAPATSVIQLTWMTFNLEASYECAYDNVQVFDNNTDLGQGALMGKFCGFNLPPMLLSSSNMMSVFFTTDVTVNMDGFLASYIFIPEKNVCGGNYFTTSGVIKSPRYPEPYPTNRECTWTINVPPGQQIMLNVTDFNIENYSGCRYDWLEIRNGGTSASPLIGKFCGTTIPKQIASHANKLHLFFKSDLSRIGHGFRITWSSTATGCGGVLTSPTGSLISPHYPEPYSTNTECLWKIITSSGSRVQVVFSDINLEKHNQCAADYVQLFDGLKINSPSLGKFCYEAPEPVKSTSNEMLVKFRSDVAFQGRGFQLHYTTVCRNTVKGFRGIIESPNFPNDYPQDQDCLWEIVVSDRNKINITFSHFELERSPTNPSANSSCLYDYVEISYAQPPEDYDETRSYTKYGRYCGSQSPGHINLDSDHVQIRFVSDKLLLGSGFRVEWEIFGCGGLLKKNFGTITSPNYPNSYPVSVVCEWRIEVDFGQSIEIEFIDVDVEKDTSCDFDSVSVYNGMDDSYNLLATICRQKKTTLISSTGNYMFVKFKSDYSYHGKGFTANYTTIPTKCGGKFTASEGFIYSPNYPNNYNKNETCEYFIDVDEGHAVEITFEDVDLFKSDNCSKNYLKIHDGPSAAYPLLITACGKDTPNDTIKSTYNNVFIEFMSHSYYTTKGFKLKYYKSCGTRILTQGNGIVEVNHDDFSESMETCTWVIVSSDPSKHIHLTVSHLQEGYYCDEDDAPFKVYNGESTDSPLIGQYCGPKVPPTITSGGAALTIHVASQMTFFGTYSVFDSQCGGSLSSSEGYFSTPGYPKTYPSDMECEWTIKISEGNHVSLNFIEFSLLESENCNTDYLEIRSFNSSGKLLGVFCGRNKPENVTHVGSVWLLFKSSKISVGDTTIAAKGLYAEYTLNERNELTGTKGEIESPLYPHSIINYKTFHWKITVAAKKRILLSFKEFYLDAKDSIDDECYFATFEVYDGVDETASSLGKYCGLTLPDPVKSTSNIMYIKVDYSNPRLGSRFRVKWQEIDGTVPGLPITPTYKTECNTTDSVIDIHSSKSYVLTSPGYPGGYEHNLKCEWTFSTIPMNHLVIYFSDIDLGINRNRFAVYRKCDMLNDNINIYQKHNYDNNWEKLQTVCKMDEVKSNVHVTDFLKIEFVTTRYLNGTGFKARIYEGCGGSLRGPTGYIIFSNSTVRSVECQWNITVSSTKTIQIDFEEMNIEHDSNKGCDNFLMIRNGKFADSPLLGTGKYCGSTLPEKLTSTANNLYIKYKGSPSIEGFRLKYQEVSAGCGGNIILTQFDNFTEITSPNYPNIPNPHIECHWLITAPVGEILRIDFEERFDLTIKQSCDIEYVEIRDGGTEFSSLVGRYCRSAPSSQYSTDNMMFIKFFTDTDEPKNGFKAKISMSRCGGTVRGSVGDLSYVSATNAKKHNCTWYIVGPTDHYLTVSFVQLETTCSKNYVSINEYASMEVFGNGSSLGKFCGKTIPPPIRSSSNQVTVTFISDGNGKFSLKFNASQTDCGGKLETESGIIESPGYPYMNHLNRNCQWVLVVPQGRRITLNLNDVDLGASSMRYERGLAVFDGSSLKIRLALITSVANITTIESSSNTMFIFFWSLYKSDHRGFRANYTSNLPSICEGDFNRENGMIKNPVSRNFVYNCEWTHRRTDIEQQKTFAVTLTIDTNYSNSAFQEAGCLYAPVFIQVTNIKKEEVLGKFCSKTITPITARSPFLITKLLTLVNSKFSLNFTAIYSTHSCGGIVYDQSGVISSPEFPNKPSKSYECAWLISLGTGQTVNVTTVSVNLGDDCEKSYLVVHNGELPSSPRIGKYCKNTKPEVLISQTNKLWIEYKHDQTSAGTGFMMKYEAMSSGCGGVFHDRKRNIRSPNYGSGGYPNNAECLWIIQSEPGYHVRLNFVDRFHLEQSNNCSNDFIEVWGWEEEQWVSLGRKCGRDTPTSLESKGEKMKILFRSNDRITGGGFKAKWEWLCGGTFLADKKLRYIVSPGYPVSYQKNLKCEYTIETKSEAINIRFVDFELEAGDHECKYDNLTISGKSYPGQYVYSKNTYCGDKMPGPIRMRGTVIVMFETDPWLNKRGFKFEYKDDSCGGDITEESVIEKGAITPTDFGYGVRYYQPKIRCVWNITAPTNQIIILKIKKLEMFMSTSCYGHNLEIYNQFYMLMPNRLAQLCGNLNDEFPIPSETGKMIVKLESMPNSFGGLIAEVRFSHGPAEGCGGNINLTETKVIQSPNLANLDCAWNIIAPRDHQIDIKVDTLSILTSCEGVNATNVTCGCTILEIRDGASPLSERIETLCITINEANQKPSIRTSANNGHIRLAIRGKNNNAFKATLTPVASACGTTVLVARKDKQTLTSPNFESGFYPSYIKCSYSISTGTVFDKLVLHFDEFDLTDEISTPIDKGAECTGDLIQIYEDPNTGVTSGLGQNVIYTGNNKQTSMIYTDVKGRHLFCGKDEKPFDFYSAGKSVTVSLVSKGKSPKGKGFKLEYSLTGCNRNYTEPQGRANNGNNRAECKFSIIVAENMTISVYFSTFYMYYTANCSESALEVRDGSETGNVLLKACGYRLPDPVFSLTNKLYFNAFNKRIGSFLMRYDFIYTSTDEGPGCGGEIFNNKGRIYSPMYPNAFRNDTICTWKIKAPIGLHLALKFTIFDIQGSCEQTNVRVDTDSTSVELCKSYQTGPVIRSKSHITIVYTSSIHNGGTGWMAHFQAVTSDVTEIN